MRVKRQRSGGLTLHLTASERPLLVAVLTRFPAVPEDYSCLSREDADSANATLREAETLRREAWSEGVSETGRWLHELKQRLTRPPPEEPVSLRLRADAVEMLLQVVNDVRVGCWIRLGCPDPLPHSLTRAGREMELPLRLMALAGLFESLIVQALGLPEEGVSGA